MATRSMNKATVKKKPAKKSAKVAKKGGKQGAAEPKLLSGGNPQIAKGDGNAPAHGELDQTGSGAARRPSLLTDPRHLRPATLADVDLVKTKGTAICTTATRRVTTSAKTGSLPR